MISTDVPLSTKEIGNSSQLPEENRCDVSFVPVKKNVGKSHKFMQKTNNKLSVLEAISSDMPPSAEEIGYSSELPEKNACDTFVPEKRNKRKSRKPMRKASHELENISDDINEPSADGNCGILTIPEMKNNSISTLLENIKSAAPNLPGKSKDNASILLDDKSGASNSSIGNVNDSSTLLNEIKSRPSNVSKKNISNTSTSVDKGSGGILLCSDVNKNSFPVLQKKGEEKCMDGLLEMADENRDTALQGNNIDGAVLLPEDDRNNISTLKNKRKMGENNVLQLPDKNSMLVIKGDNMNSEELLKNKNISSVIQNNEERNESDLSPLPDNNRVLQLSEESSNSVLDEEIHMRGIRLEGNGNNSSLVLLNKKEKSENSFSPLTDGKDSVLPSPQESSTSSPPAFQDRSSDSVVILQEGERNAIVSPEEITISSDSSVSYDQYRDSKSQTQETVANCVLDLAEKNLIT